MAATAKLFGQAIIKLFEGQFYLTNTESYLKIMLLSSAAAPNQDTWDYIADVTNEIAAGNGYATGGKGLMNPTITYNAGTKTIKIDADDVTWPASSITARYAVIYDEAAYQKALLCYIDFGANQTTNNEDFTISFDAAGICTFTIL